jgi:hypothetical protein
MKCSYQDKWEIFVGLAEGISNDDANMHLASCPECNKKFKQLTKMMQAMSFEHFTVPQADIDRAKALMPETVRRFSLLRTSLNLSGARSANQDFQAVYGAEGIELRVMYLKTEAGWDVVSQVPEMDWNVLHHDNELTTDPEGRFQFETATLEDSQFRLKGSEVTFEIPSIGASIDGPNLDS